PPLPPALPPLPYVAQPPRIATEAAPTPTSTARRLTAAGTSGAGEGVGSSFVIMSPDDRVARGAGQKCTPDVVKNHRDEVSHNPTSAVKTTPPSTGSAQPGTPLRDSVNIFTVNAPKNRQPRMECM